MRLAGNNDVRFNPESRHLIAVGTPVGVCRRGSPPCPLETTRLFGAASVLPANPPANQTATKRADTSQALRLIEYEASQDLVPASQRIFEKTVRRDSWLAVSRSPSSISMDKRLFDRNKRFQNEYDFLYLAIIPNSLEARLLFSVTPRLLQTFPTQSA